MRDAPPEERELWERMLAQDASIIASAPDNVELSSQYARAMASANRSLLDDQNPGRSDSSP